MTGLYHAYIIDADGDLKVRPSYAAVDKTAARDPDGNIWFAGRNLTGYVATVSFTGRSPVSPGRRPRRASRFVIRANSVGLIPISSRASGMFPYQVELQPVRGRGVNVKARGESSPGMIVDP